MSAGTPKYVFRLDDETAQLVHQTITRRNDWTRDVEWSFSDFIRIALVEKCRKMERSRRPRKRVRRAVGPCLSSTI